MTKEAEVEYTLVTMPAVPAYELFCELANVIGEDLLALVLNESINIHLLIARKCEHPEKVRKVLSKLVEKTVQFVTVDGALHTQDNMSLKLWTKLVSVALKHQFGEFFLELQGEFSKTKPSIA